MSIKRILISGVVLISVIACQNTDHRKKGISKGNVSFRENSFSFGEIKHGEVVGHSFKCYNTGSEPVMILHIEKSCGCTDVKFPEKPILPGDSAYVELVFVTRGWNGRQVKQVKVFSNDSIGIRELRIWADIQ